MTKNNITDQDNPNHSKKRRKKHVREETSEVTKQKNKILKLATCNPELKIYLTSFTITHKLPPKYRHISQFVKKFRENMTYELAQNTRNGMLPQEMIYYLDTLELSLVLKCIVEAKISEHDFEDKEDFRLLSTVIKEWLPIGGAINKILESISKLSIETGKSSGLTPEEKMAMFIQEIAKNRTKVTDAEPIELRTPRRLVMNPGE